MTLTDKQFKAQKRDHQKFFVEKGDDGFSPKRNKAIIDKTIKKYELNRKRKMKQYKDQVGERSDAIVAYFKSLKAGNTPIESYFGKRNLAKLRGDDIRTSIEGRVVPNAKKK